MKTIIAVLILTNLVAHVCCMDYLASKGYFLSSPRIRNILIRTGLANLIGRKASTMYEASNFQSVSDQGTNIRKAEMNNFDIVETGPGQRLHKRISPAPAQNTTKEDRMYSEKLFTVLNDMDKNSCISRLMCEIGAEPNSFGIIGLKISHYLKSVPPVTWNSATFTYLEAFNAGFKNGNKDMCSVHYTSCRLDLRRVIKFLWMFINPINLKMESAFLNR